jgi:hypothetical protein
MFRSERLERMRTVAPLLASLALAGLLAAGCGGSSKPASSAATTTAPSGTAAGSTAAATTPSALQAEANSAATGDIPDNQVFLTFHDAKGGWTMKYPEGWAQRGSGSHVAFRDKNNIVRVVVAKGARRTAHTIRAQLKGFQVRSGPQRLSIAGAPAVKVVYSTRSAPNSVTGKRVTLMVDRYYLSQGSKEAIVDLGTPQGVDNVDAYRLMIESFRWK